MRIIIATLTAVAALATLAMLMGFPLDLWIATLFYDPARGAFPAATNPYLGMMRGRGYLAAVACLATVTAAIATWMLRRLQRVIPGRVVLFLVLSLALGPGVIVNGVLKEFWDRPRPIQVTQFGGNLTYVDWWNPRGGCDRNCSFVSGEVAAAAWMFAPAILAPAQWRAVAFAGAAIFTLVIAVTRVAAGAHFFSDVLLALLLMLLLIALLHRLIVGRARV